MTLLTTQTSVLPEPLNTETWAALYARFRQIPGAETEATVTELQLKEAVAKAIDTVGDRVYVREHWTVLSAIPLVSVDLPWAPTGIVSCVWKHSLSPRGEKLNDWWWDVQGTTWYWMGPPLAWPGGSVTLELDVIGKPESPFKTASPTATVSADLLWPFVELELAPIIQRQEGLPTGVAVASLNQARTAALAMMQAPSPPRVSPPDLRTRLLPATPINVAGDERKRPKK